MVNKLLLPVIFVFTLMLCSCEYFAGAAAGKIIPPPEKASPFSGKWEVASIFDPKTAGDDDAGRWLSESVQFPEDAIVFGGQFWEGPSYRVKRVSAAAYMATKNIDTPVMSDAGVRTTDVITVFAAGSYLGEFMIIDESNMVFFVQNTALLLKKVSDQTDSLLLDAYSEAQSAREEGAETMSGVLIGLRTKTVLGDYTYRTLWIAADANGLRPILESGNIFFPRMSGFWESVTEDVREGENWSNTLNARGAFTKDIDASDFDEAQGDDVSDVSDDVVGDAVEPADDAPPAPVLTLIGYIGNDYVSAESVSGGVRELHVLPVDSLPSPTKIKIADLLGENGDAAYFKARNEAVLSLMEEGVNVFSPDDYGENFGLAREKGHWKLVGRINYESADTFNYLDFDLKIIPPNKLVFFDKLALNWNRIKDRVPDALDAFTSPDQNIAIVKTKNKISVYRIGAEQLSETSLGEVELADDETIVMAEWATAIYVDSWEKAFIAYGAHKL